MELSYVSIVSEQLDELKDFYVEALSLTELVDWSHEGFRAVQVDPGVVMAFHSPDALGELGLRGEPAMTTMLTFDPGSPRELRRLHAELVDRDVLVIREPFDTPYGSVQSIYRDPDGNPFRLNTFTR